MSDINDKTVVEKQYATSTNLNTRISIHDKYSTNKQGFGNWIFSHYEIDDGARVLELGCGPGSMWKGHEALIKKCSQLVLSDFSDAMVETTRQTVGAHPNITYRSIDIQNIPYDTATFDAVIQFKSVMYLRKCFGYRVVIEAEYLILSMCVSQVDIDSPHSCAVHTVKVCLYLGHKHTNSGHGNGNTLHAAALLSAEKLKRTAAGIVCTQCGNILAGRGSDVKHQAVNFPNVAAPCRFVIGDVGDYTYRGVTNVVLAAGAVDLYERKTTDLSEAAAAVEKAIAETGKFVTNNILFETGKATLKPESMEEIQRVAEYMKANPTARFEVQGHTDSQGSDKINDPLSQQRAEAVVKALEDQGVDPFNLRPVGKGSHEPVADNGTEEGRAQNRRVEFIKR